MSQQGALSPPHIGLVGLGRMGSALLPRLLNGGLPVTVWNRDRAKVQAASELGARLAINLQDLCREADIILTVLFDDAALRDVFLASGGLLSRPCDGKLFVDLSTIRPGTARRIADAVCFSAASFINAAICGSVAPAAEGKLLTLAAGSRGDLERAQPVPELFSRKGSAGSAAGLSASSCSIWRRSSPDCWPSANASERDRQ